MDKTLLKAYIRTIVEEEVKKILPELLSEAVTQIKQLSESAKPATKPTIDRNRLAELMGITYDGETLKATTNNLAAKQQMFTTTDSAGNKVQIPADRVDPTVADAITRDYSQLMKAMKIV